MFRSCPGQSEGPWFFSREARCRPFSENQSNSGGGGKFPRSLFHFIIEDPGGDLSLFHLKLLFLKKYINFLKNFFIGSGEFFSGTP